MTLSVWQLDPAQMTPYYNLALCAALAEAGAAVRYVTTPYLYDPDLPTPPGVARDHHYFRGQNHRALLRVPALRRTLRAATYPLGHLRLLGKLRRQRPDILHVQWSRLPRLDRPFIHAVKRLGLPVVHTIHNVRMLYDHDPNSSALGDIYAAADALIIHSETNRADFLAAYPALPPEKVHVIPLIACPNRATPPEASRAAARAALDLPPDAPVILFFGAVKDYKGLDGLATAFEEIRQTHPAAWLLVAGQPDGPASAALLAEIAARPRTRVRAGFVPSGDVWQYHLAADVIAFPYRRITQSGALVTALDFARPVVVTDVGGMPELVDGNGWVVPPQDPPALAVALRAALDHPEPEALGARSREIVRAICAPEVVAAATLRLYRDVLAGRNRDGG